MNKDTKELADYCGMTPEEFLAEERELKYEIPADPISLIPGDNICYDPFKIISGTVVCLALAFYECVKKN